MLKCVAVNDFVFTIISYLFAMYIDNINMHVYIIEINVFWGDLTDVSA